MWTITYEITPNDQTMGNMHDIVTPKDMHESPLIFQCCKPICTHNGYK
jgi:hypothetical protein